MQSIALLMSASVVLLLDQGAKLLIRERIQEGQRVSLPGFSLCRRINNRGAMARSASTITSLWVVELMFLIVLSHMVSLGSAAPIALGSALGGAASNLLDIRRLGGVVDFIDVGFGRVFNIADAAIVVGIAVSVVAIVGIVFS